MFYFIILTIDIDCKIILLYIAIFDLILKLIAFEFIFFIRLEYTNLLFNKRN